MKIIKLTDQITQVECDSQHEVASRFCRIQEFYESPEFMDKIFTLGQLRKWYSTKHGAWDYYQRWSGFNVPDIAFKPFIEGLFDPLSKQEEELIELFRYKAMPFYVIGTSTDSEEDVVQHEFLHGLFYTVPWYRESVLKEMEPYEAELKPLKAHIAKLGYNKKVWDDECQAYIGASTEYLAQEEVEYPKELTWKIMKLKSKAEKGNFPVNE